MARMGLRRGISCGVCVQDYYGMSLGMSQESCKNLGRTCHHDLVVHGKEEMVMTDYGEGGQRSMIPLGLSPLSVQSVIFYSCCMFLRLNGQL